MKTRRQFLAMGSLTALFAAVISPALLLKRAGVNRLADLHVGRFTPLVNSDFIVSGATADAMALKLISAERINADPQGRSFSLRFTGPANQVLPQGIHELKHDEVGAIAVFMVPQHEGRNGRYYEVLFNRAA
ncbi:MAG TPA: hypothetical protein VEH04_18625 [Verrucomicrobiae bacterium]|nr:hypothetical protein [Verrucomicrobiae bacterium]